MTTTIAPELDDLSWLCDDVEVDAGPTPAATVLATLANSAPPPSASTPMLVYETVDAAADAVDILLSWESRIERLDEQHEAATRRYKARRAFLEKNLEECTVVIRPSLERFYAEHPPHKGKTLHLPTGDLALKKLPGAGELHIKNRDVCIAWVKEKLPAAFRTKVVEDIDDARVRLHFIEHGEVPDGAEVKPEIEKLYIRPPTSRKKA